MDSIITQVNREDEQLNAFANDNKGTNNFEWFECFEQHLVFLHPGLSPS